MTCAANTGLATVYAHQLMNIFTHTAHTAESVRSSPDSQGGLPPFGDTCYQHARQLSLLSLLYAMINYLESVWLPIDLIIADFCLTVKFCLTFSCNCMVSYMPRCFPTMQSLMVHIKLYVCGVHWLNSSDWLTCLVCIHNSISPAQVNRSLKEC